MCTSRMAMRPFLSGAVDQHLPVETAGAQGAGSSTSGRLVAASGTRPDEESKPSSSTSNWLRVCSFSSWPPMPEGAAGTAHRAEFVDEDDCRSWRGLLEEVAHPAAADADEHFDEFLRRRSRRKGTPASPATALASRVLPVPGGPTSSTPSLKASAETAVGFRVSESRRPLFNSSLASSTPATSSKVTPVLDST